MRDLMADQFPRVQRLAIRGNDLATHTRRMLFCLDRYWLAYEGGSPQGFDEMWWTQYERSRATVEALILAGGKEVRNA